MDENVEANAFVGKTFAGKYRVDGLIGVGGMGYVLAATHLHIDEPVAIKLLFSALASKPEIVQRFMREAKAARKIRSEHVVRVLDVDTLENGTPFIVMEHLQGQDLEGVLRRMGRQPVATALDVLMQAMEALAEAHVQRMVHRDLKPANLFVTKRPDGDALVKVLDFGISKVTGQGGADLNVTQAGDSILGSPQYMAPEQLKSLKDVDARTDIWALGSILYEMLAGQPPFNAASLPELCVEILDRDPASLRTMRPDVPAGLEAVILQCLAKEPSGRPDNVSAMASALAPFCPPAVQASAGRIAGIFRTARFAREGGGTAAMSTVSPAQIAAMQAAMNQSGALSNPNPVSSPHPNQVSTPGGGPVSAKAQTRISSPPSGPPPPNSTPPPPINPPPVATTLSSVGIATTSNAFSKSQGASLRPPAQENPARFAAMVLGGAAVVITLIVVFVALPWVRARNAQRPIPSATATVPVDTPTAPASETVPPPPESATPAPPASETPSETAAETTDAAALTAAASASAVPAASASTRPSVKYVPQVDCSTPFVVDADGIKRWKRGCVH